MKARTNISLKERRSLTLSDFKGVDFSSSTLNVKSNRATNMRNFINEHGVNKKRNGWNQLIRIKENGEVQPINGIFEYSHKTNIGLHEALIVHAGARFYRIEKTDGVYNYAEYDDITEEANEAYRPITGYLKSERSQAFFNKNRMYIIGCGDFLVYGTWDNGDTYQLRRVADNEDTYVPTTSISVISTNNQYKIGARTSHDEINLLSSIRKNKALGTEEKSGYFELDAKVKEGTAISVVVETVAWTTAKVLQEDGSEKVQTFISDKPVTIKLDNQHDFENKYILLVQEVIYNDDLTAEQKEKMDSLKNIGALSGINGSRSSCLYLGGFLLKPQVDGQDNVTVTFYPDSDTDEYARRIGNCRFGTLFGAGGNTDRLFLSGNPDYPNCDFHSASDDFTYFEERAGKIAMGSDQVPVKGYSRLSDSSLVIYKAENGQEESIYYRTGTYRDRYDEDGNLTYFRGEFPTYAGSIGEGAINPYTCANLAGDSIILSRNGVFGVVLGQNVATTERYTRERSRLINEKLCRNKDLSDAVGIVYDNKYYLAVGGECYIADARHKYVPTDSVDSAYEYEWWYWDHMPVRVWANIGGKLIFGTAEGQICEFDDKYTDRSYHEIKGAISIGNGSSHITCGTEDYSWLSENDRITFTTEGIYALIIDTAVLENGRIKTSEEKIFTIHEGMEVYADTVGGSGLAIDMKYKIRDIDAGNCTFSLASVENEVITLKAGGFRLLKNISNVELYATNVTENQFSVKEYKSGSELILSGYNGSTPYDISVTATDVHNVIAEWFTPVFDLGTNESSKTLLKMTISTGAEVNGKLSFGYETRNVSRLIGAKGINVFSFDNFSFENFSFDTGFANSYSVRCNERNFNFILFRFISDNDSNCVVNSFTAIYKINKSNKGVM